MTYPNDVYERLNALEAQVRHLAQVTGVELPLVRTEMPTFAAASSSPALPVEVQQALASGNKIAAIKAYREATGADLATAKAWVDGY